MKRGVLLLIILSTALLAASVSAQGTTCTLTINAKDTDALLKEIPAIHSSLQTCPVPLGGLSKVFKNSILRIRTTEGDQMTAEIKNGNLVGMYVGAQGIHSYTIDMGRCELDAILSSSNKLGAFAYLYLQKKIKITGNSFGDKFRFVFVAPIMNGVFKRVQTPVTLNCQPSGTTTAVGGGKPNNCHETYLPGFRDYGLYPAVKAKWDQYTADSRGHCQVDVGQGRPDKACKYMVELIEGGFTSYVCWYD